MGWNSNYSSQLSTWADKCHSYSYWFWIPAEFVANLLNKNHLLPRLAKQKDFHRQLTPKRKILATFYYEGPLLWPINILQSSCMINFHSPRMVQLLLPILWKRKLSIFYLCECVGLTYRKKPPNQTKTLYLPEKPYDCPKWPQLVGY